MDAKDVFVFAARYCVCVCVCVRVNDDAEGRNENVDICRRSLRRNGQRYFIYSKES